MAESLVSERLRLAREARHEALPELAKRVGVRKEHLRAIEDGRFDELPPGIYARAAVRSVAIACGCDAAEILAACGALLPAPQDPIAGLARARGLRVSTPEVRPIPSGQPVAPTSDTVPVWRRLAAAVVDASVIVTLLLAVVLSAAAALAVRISAFNGTAAAFGVMGVLLAVAYFVCFGGIGGTTPGERALGVDPGAKSGSALTPGSIVARALRASTEDVRTIRRCGASLARSRVVAWRTQRA
ncbi:MAG TPA: helix-turn-helix domain-containing protein [Vicinamibacterales bacterium]|nr:helix-turn-helix domain-containing protein [Vicinamibacterales bacterium]